MPPRPRREIIDPHQVGIYHCWSRCVRRAFLCGTDRSTRRSFDHRQDWILQRLRHLVGGFAIDLLSYAILENHVHLMPRNRPDIAAVWTDEEVVHRWWHVCPMRRNADGEPDGDPKPVELNMWLADSAHLSTLRERLSDVSWFLRLLKQNIARRANREDNVTGHFWEGRFDSSRLPHDAAILAGSVYVDLNALRAGKTPTPERSAYTSVADRIAGRRLRCRKMLADARSWIDPGAGACTSPETWPSDPDAWLSPIPILGGCPSECLYRCEANPFGSPRVCNKGFLEMSLESYLSLLDWTGRRIRKGKRGTIPEHLAPILQRLEWDDTTWIEAVTDYRRWLRGQTHRAALKT